MNERTRLVVAMSIAAIILFGWTPLLRTVEHATGWKLLPPPPSVASTQPAVDETAPSSTQPNGTGHPATTGPAGSVKVATQPAGGYAIAAPTTVPAEVLIGSTARNDPDFAVAMQVTPVGGGLADVTLNNYKASVLGDEPFHFELPYGDGTEAFATRSIKINGRTQDLTASVWRVDHRTDRSVAMALDLTDGGKPVVTLVKTYEIEPRSEGGGQGALGYDTKFTLDVQNRSAASLTVSSIINGPVFPPSEQMRGGDRQVIAGYQGKNTVVLRHDTTEGFAAAPKEYADYQGQTLLWIGAGGNYFNAIVRPIGTPWLKSATAYALNPESETHVRQVVTVLETTEATVAPGASHADEARVFFGPRKREILKNPYYAAAGVGYYHTLETSASCAICTFQWLVDLLMTTLGLFQVVLRSWGLSIIALVFIVRAVLHPITKRAQINMAKMGKMGPEIERIKKKYGDDKDGLNRAMMDFYKTQGATPILGCLPMFLQMPIWIALYSGLSSTFELRQAPFLSFFGHNLTWINDLSKPDHLLEFQPFNIFFLHLDGLNVIPVLLAGAFFLQQKFTPKPPATTPEQVQQQKMMQWMTLLFPVMLYSSPSGLNIYILASTIFGVIESRIIRKHIKEREALAPVGPTFIDGDVVRAESTPLKKPGGGMFGWFAQLQEKAEQIRLDAEKKARQKKR